MFKSVLLAVAALFPIVGAAEDLRMQVSGSVTKLTYADCQTYADSGRCTSWTFSDIAHSDFVNGASVSVGDTYSFDFVYDNNAPLSSISPDGFQAIYFSAVREQAFSAGQIQLPGTGLPSSNVGAISVVDGRSGYDYLLFQTVFGGEPEFSASLNLGFQDRTGQVFDSFELPSSIDLAKFTEAGIGIGFIRHADGDQMTLTGSIDQVAITPIPEPSIPLLFSAGLVVVAIADRRRRSSRA